MNKNKLKTYAPKARQAFIQAVTDRAHYYGLSKDNQEPVMVEGDFAIIAGQAHPKAVADQRKKLEERISASSFDHVMEEIAYTWFNRLVAIRYMELHGYLSHGYRVLSNPEPDNDIPEILDKAQHVTLPGLNKDRVVELKMDGTQDEELYRMLLVAQCNELYHWMPFLFENIKDCTELLLPDKLLHSASLIRDLVNEIEKSDWQEVEIIGWMYQFYISEKKDQVIGKVVKSEDIPAATQLFTPNWIVKYLVQNSLGAQWMATYPNSSLKEKMEFYIEPAEQTEEVQRQLAEITPDALNPEELTLLDPACGSGHILAEAYDLLKEIYLERGYRKRDIAELILKKNLFGLEIDDRAAQLAGFAIMMKARADDRQLFDKQVQPNIVSIQESKELDVHEIVRAINAPLTDKNVEDTPSSLEELQTAIETPLFAASNKKAPVLDDQEKLTVDDLTTLLGLFEHGKTFGSLIRVPDLLAKKLPAMAERVTKARGSGDPYAQAQAVKVEPFIRQALIMAGKYDAIVANPPYMGSGGMNGMLKKFARDHFPDTKSDLFACFIDRGYTLAKDTGHNAMVTMQSWMFLSSFEKMRACMLREKTIRTTAHLGARAFGSISGEVVQTTACVLQNRSLQGYKPVFIRLLDGGEEEKRAALANGEKRFATTTQDELKKIPGSPIAYWLSDRMRHAFEAGVGLGKSVAIKSGMSTTDNERFLRMWWEIDRLTFSTTCSTLESASESLSKWFPFKKGGEYRKWYGNDGYVLNWRDDGREIKTAVVNNPSDPNTRHWSRRIFGVEHFFKPGITWTKISTSDFSCRWHDCGHIFSDASNGAFPEAHPLVTLGLLNSSVGSRYLKIISPTLNYKAGDVSKLPVLSVSAGDAELVDTAMKILVEQSSDDWDAYERSWDFQSLPILPASSDSTPALESRYTTCISQNRDTVAEMKRLEEENNRLFIDAYGLQDELTPDVPIEQITLTVNPAYRYGGKLTEEEQWTRFRQDTMAELVSYAIGCMMGRYSLDEPGLIYAHSGNEDFDPNRYTKFPADDDGLVPLTDTEWFDDDACNRLIEFISVAWDSGHLEDNLTFLADNLGPKKSESSRETMRRYICDSFFKGHLKTYKKRPIYWLFTSGKKKAFQCLVYLHRYNEGTLARMRTEYVIPLQGRINSRIEMLTKDVDSATSTSAASKIRKEITKLERQAEELMQFDEKLRHYADMKIKLDLDDGVKVNYGKFGDLLAEVKAVTGKKPD